MQHKFDSKHNERLERFCLEFEILQHNIITIAQLNLQEFGFSVLATACITKILMLMINKNMKLRCYNASSIMKIMQCSKDKNESNK